MVTRKRSVGKSSESVIGYLKRKKWVYEESAGRLVVKTCPYCSDQEKHFYINPLTSQFICFKCDVNGNIYKLKKDLGDISPVSTLPSTSKIPKSKYNKIRRGILANYKSLLEDSEALESIKTKWGFGIGDVKKFKLGVQVKGGKKWIVIPYFENGKVINAKYETLPPAKKKFRRLKGMKSGLFNIDSVERDVNYLFLCEGESDAISLSRIGVKNVVGVSVGARGFKPEWYDFVSEFEKVYVVYDNDVAGQDGARKLAKRIGMDRCVNVEIPVERGITDVTDFLMDGNDLKDFQGLLKSAQKFDVDDVVSFKSILNNLESELAVSNTVDGMGYLTQWDNLNKLTGSFVPGDLIVLSGIAKVGKSTFGLNLLLEHSLMGIPTLYYCLEMRPERIVTRVVSYVRCVSKDNITRDDVIYVRSLYGNKPFYIAHSYSFTVEKVMDTIAESVKRYGIELLLFDHLHFLIRSLDNTTAEVSNTVRQFKLLAEELQIPIFLVAQPRKLSGKRQRPTVDDLRDSSSIGQDADTVIVIHRNRVKQDGRDGSGNKPLFDNDTEVIVDASRYSTGGIAKLYFDGELSRFFQNQKERREFLSRVYGGVS